MEKRSPNLITIALGALLVIALVAIGIMATNQNKVAKEKKKTLDSLKNLQESNDKFSEEISKLQKLNEHYKKEKEDLLSQKDRLIKSRDSVQRLLAYSFANERNAKTKVVQLEKKLKELQAQLDDVQRKYDEAVANSGATDAELKKRIDALQAQNRSLQADNERLQAELGKVSANADNRTALFVRGMSAIPGELSRNKFEPSKRSQNIDRVQVTFGLSRAPRPTESIIFKVFDNTGKEIALKPKYRNDLNTIANPTNIKLILEFEKGFLERRAEGVFSVRAYLTDVNKGVENQEIGSTPFNVD
jgi:myosin heavy subunit